jgi:tetratricopeptide (TPR) repeat protein
VSCLQEETILGFVEGRLDTEELARVEAHTRECQLCDELLAAAFPTPAVKGDLAWRVLARGTRIGRYTALDLVGVGGMSEVYAAYDPDLDRKIALKFVRPSGPMHDPRDQTRLMREAQAIARLSHPNVVTVHDIGTFGDRVFIAMEYVDGQTLSSWLAKEQHTWQEIVAVLVDAARGLSAAHAAHIVHRDFKPQNVMIGRDGLVRVMDFGLAQRIGAAVPTEAGATALGADSAAATIKGASELAGTPLFMAPEQIKGEPADARSDQFSFCVTLHQALYGVHPFLDESSLGSAGRILAPRLKLRPARGGVPAWLAQAVARGLSEHPDQRWPSVDDLAKALLQAPTGKHRRRAFAITAMVLLVAGAAGLGRASRKAPALCPGGAEELGDAWSLPRGPQVGPQRRDQVRAAFLATGKETAQETWDRTSALLDRYAGHWLAMRHDACEATHVRGEQSPEVLDLRMVCLDDRRQGLEALTRVLAQADKQSVSKAVDAVGALPALDRCADVRLLRDSRVPFPNADVAARAADIRGRAAATKAMFDVGDRRGLERAQALLAEARALGYAPLVADMLTMVGRFDDDLGFGAEASVLLRESGQLALTIRRDDIAAEAYQALAGSFLWSRPEESLIWSNVAEALLERAGHAQDRLRSWLLNDRAIARGILLGDHETAQRLFRETLTLKTKTLPPDDPDVLRTLVSQAEDLHLMGRNEEALEITTHACRSFAVAYGPGSNHEALCLSNQGEYLVDLGRATEAISVFDTSLSHWEADLGPDHRFLAFPLTGLGRAQLALGRPREARSFLERALRIREASETDPARKAETEFALAQVLWSTGETARAERLAVAARERYRTAPLHARETRDVENWISRHGPRRVVAEHREPSSLLRAGR